MHAARRHFAVPAEPRSPQLTEPRKARAKAAAPSKAKVPAKTPKRVVAAKAIPAPKAKARAAKAPAKKAPTVAKPRKTAKPAAPARPALLDLILKTLDAGKAEEVVELNLMGRNPLTDYMVVASGRSQRHVGALAEQLAEQLKAEGYGTHVEGLAACDWVLVDALDVIVHLFRPEVRAFYNLEQMWSEEPAPIAQAG